MRRAYLIELAQLESQSTTLCTVTSGCLRDATRALLDGDLPLAEQAMATAVMIPPLRQAADARALDLLARQAPVASDLRAVVAALWNVADLHRMAARAIEVARTVCRPTAGLVVPEPVRPIIGRMGELGVRVAVDAGAIIRDRDVGLVGAVESADLEMDDLLRCIFDVVQAPSWSQGVAAAIDMTLLGRCYERFADHAVAIARREIFVVTGRGRPALYPPVGAGAAVPVRPIRDRPQHLTGPGSKR